MRGKQEAYRRKLGPFLKKSEFLTANQIAQLFDIDLHTVINRWIGKYGLSYTLAYQLGYRRGYFIRYEHLISWHASALERFTLGIEPQWLVQKRKSDLST